MRRHTAVHKDEIERLLHADYILVYVAGWYWLINGMEEPIRANCNSAKAVLRGEDCPEVLPLKGWHRRSLPDYVKEK